MRRRARVHNRGLCIFRLADITAVGRCAYYATLPTKSPNEFSPFSPFRRLLDDSRLGTLFRHSFDDLYTRPSHTTRDLPSRASPCVIRARVLTLKCAATFTISPSGRPNVSRTTPLLPHARTARLRSKLTIAEIARLSCRFFLVLISRCHLFYPRSGYTEAATCESPRLARFSKQVT